MAGLTREQVDVLLQPIRPHRVAHSQGQSHVEAYEISAHLTRIFGFCNWEKVILELECIRSDPVPDPKKSDRIGWYVTYRCQMRLRLKDGEGNVIWENDDVACGEAQNQPSHGDAHDQASKTAVSQAEKRCAKDLGDQMGLSLYRKGSLEPVVGKTLVMPGASGGETADVEAAAPETAPEEEPTSDAEPVPEAHVEALPPADPHTGELHVAPAPSDDVRMISRTQRARLEHLAGQCGMDHDSMRDEGNRLLLLEPGTSSNEWRWADAEIVREHFEQLAKQAKAS